ncbi:metallophosphatase [Polymorphobacter multimanifer]|uniref:Ligase-associated DNA damage response endonuclease PdeM n=1 Tax=Polymorphobacter multimanifer TaxID=1070431 RepID=A0A841L6W6_9SPHN|nr:ligase-associated DNA damage response endonuclease PdeM [Polymorphobacter multimanifer]MBB6228719.1 hypothetical protein [Polymorphobacter multimanifer]GGI83688.1 metallophosphatase [Polymorphobacter multimanifer]
MPLLFSSEHLIPLPCGALHWPARGALLVADLHLEKASHFARRGWPLPPYDSEVTLTRLAAALAHTGATTLIALGDTFHDPQGPARLPSAARNLLAQIASRAKILWITGNHDDAAAATLHGTAHPELVLGPLTLRHEADPADPAPELSGHFHPKVIIRHRGRAISRRCFALSPTKLILPAYGSLAGGLDITDPALAAAAPGGLIALVPEAGQLLRFPVVAQAA